MNLTGQQFHLIGIGGAGMSAVAELLQREGAQVSGSDRQETPVLDRLRSLGILAHSSHDPQFLPAAATVVVSSAIRESNPELATARSRSQKVIHRSQALALAAEGKEFVAVAGAHGKTTTSAMLAQALEQLGAGPSSAIGGVILGHGTGALMGEGAVFVAEADESDGSFLNYRPAVALVTNVEADHLDHFGSVAAFEDVFFQFASRIRPGGTLICCADDPGSARLAARAAAELPRIAARTYGRAADADFRIVDTQVGPSSATARVRLPSDGDVCLELRVSGMHNVLNATGALAAGLALGFSAGDMAAGLASFHGAGRRFELLSNCCGRQLYDDYAHHPTEVAAALRQGRQAAGDGRLVVVFQPHLYSRTLNFAARFADALSVADEVVLADIYAAREDPVPGVSAGLIAAEMSSVAQGSAQGGESSPAGPTPQVHVAQGLGVDGAARLGAELTAPGDTMMLVGAGDIFLGASVAQQVWQAAS